MQSSATSAEIDQIKFFFLPKDAGVLNRQTGTFRDPDGSKGGGVAADQAKPVGDAQDVEFGMGKGS